MAKARLYFDGDNTYIEKQARIYKMVDEIGDKIDNIPGVINDLNSTSETDALSAAMWKELQDQINAMSWNFHFLSSWDCTTGLPWSDPATDPYVYQSWDYYIVSNTGSTNYKPHWSSYTHWVASTAVETQPVQMNDWYVYDGSTWILQPSGWAQIVVDTALSTTSTNPVENRVITQALNNKQNTISNLSAIESWAAAWATALQPWANITQLTNNAWYQTAWDVATAVSWKQDVLTEGDGIDITNNVISCTVEYTWWTDIEVTSNNVINFTNASWYMLKSSNKLIYATTDTAFNTRDKVCTTAEWNYTPREWDVLALTFNHWCWVGSPRLNIDNSWLHSIVISSTGWANASTLWLGMSKIAWMFVYDWTNRVTWPIKDTTYTAWTWLSLSSWTFTNTQPWPTIWTTAPSSPSEWAMWYDTTNHVLKVYNGTEWEEVGSWWGWGSTTWWNIWGILSNQTDLQDALDWKQDTLTAWNGIVIQQWQAVRLPSWYTEVEYIQSDWNCYIDTQVVSAWTDYVENHFQKLWTSTTTCSWFGSWEWVSLYRMSIWSYYNQQTQSPMFFWWYNYTHSVWSLDTNKNVIKLYSNWTDYYVQLGDNVPSTYTPQTTGAITATSYLFARHWANWQSNTYDNEWTKIFYHLQKTINWTPKMELIPCTRDSDDEPGFYDLVNERFLYNEWTGTLTAWPEVTFDPATIISVDDTVWTDDNVVAWTGISIDTWTSARLPSWYTEVEWIQSNGNCAIDSGITIAQMDKAIIVWNFVQNLWWFRAVLWADNQNAVTWKFAVVMWEWSGWQYYTESVEKVWTPSGTRLDYVYSSAPVDTNEHTFSTWYSGATAYLQVDNYIDTIQTCTRSTWVTTTLWIFARHLQVSDTFATNSTMFKMKSIKMRNWSNVVFEWVPCKRDSDNAIWLYDLVSETFLENEGSGTLTAWPAVTFDPTKVISSTVAWFGNLTYDSSANGNLTATTQQAVAFPSTAKVAFFTRTANHSTSGVRYASGQAVLFKNMFLTSFVWWWDSSNYINGQVWYDWSSYIIYTQDSASTNMRISYVVYFYK